jgi:hypothetical protein
VLIAGWMPRCLRCMAGPDQRCCARCGTELSGRPSYALRDRLYCADCVDVVRAIVTSIRPEPIGVYRDSEDLHAEVMAWVAILDQMLEEGGDAGDRADLCRAC